MAEFMTRVSERLSILMNTGIYTKFGSGMREIAGNSESCFREGCIVGRGAEITQHPRNGIEEFES